MRIHLKSTNLDHKDMGKLLCGRSGKNTIQVGSLIEFKALPRDLRCLWCGRLTKRI